MNDYCPKCRRPLPPADAGSESPFVRTPYFPFCSERCKMADLYGWLDEQYRIPVVEPDDDFDDEDADSKPEINDPEDS
ncbi:MAG: DNA gyrase inhibitor YacG [Phycisphaerae bacterium]|nr:DNA gyrase inhibitor YacG [Phycisphaerae bacterium]